MKNRYVGTLFSVDSALYKITELLSQGYSEKQITAVAHTEDDMAQLREQTAVPVEGREKEDFHSRFTSMFMDNDLKRENMFEEMGFSKEESENIYQEMKDGGIALFVEDVEPVSHIVGLSNSEDVSRDSSTSMTNSGELLSDSNTLDNTEETMPRLNTDNL
ncbi:general stress protein [Sporosarcina sp. Sa2YVA2]|uniref:General stress protein n=1 Tax=Sporosarcina quadrami TaxID=2762234 RepID=A0ABR8UCA6_9BACL|nr:general stress protein [Sporosarcina quadrami]MBD7985636.1 general stress protein [Sporosarcina quadrami]